MKCNECEVSRKSGDVGLEMNVLSNTYKIQPQQPETKTVWLCDDCAKNYSSF